jgi:ribosomal protein L11 methylase PrmA
MLSLAAPKPSETLIDLGCGDGRIIVAAAQRYGCRAIGYDIDPRRVEEARARIADAGVSDRVRAEVGNMFDVDLSKADVVMLYLLPQLNENLIPQLQRLHKGARVVSHDFNIAGINPNRVIQEYLPGINLYKTYFLYVAPLRAETPVRHEWVESARMSWERPPG